MASPTSTNLTLPDNLPFPIRITNLIAKPNEPVSRGSPLCDYSFEYLVPASSSSNSTSDGAAGPSKPKREKETRYGRWECALDGTFDKWLITKGAVIRDVQHARQQPAAIILEECPHSMQLHGLCALCGKDMTGTDYLGTPSALATIPLTHSANGPTVTLSEAMRYDAELSQRLLNERKLSLIVDLDQTIVHATVDPTVGEWMSEREKWLSSHKAQQGDVKGKGKARDGAAGKEGPKTNGKDGGGDVESTSSSSADAEDTTSATNDAATALLAGVEEHLPSGEPTIDEEAEENPNWPALSDVKRFKLPGEGRTAEDDGSSWYYIKPRPGLASFLNNLKTKYEMHVYTMGTRAYAFEVCKAIDPDQSVFGQRVLTRDESGSMTSKNLQRLFPSDQSMVAVIDDRADVWADVPNLVKVNPYDFFVGIGDINSAHLPVVAPPPGSAPLPASIHPHAPRTPSPLSTTSTLPSPSSTPEPSSTPSTPPTSDNSSPPSPSTTQPSSAPSSPSLQAKAKASADATSSLALAAAESTTSSAGPEEVINKVQAVVIGRVVAERPLARMQEVLDAEEDDEGKEVVEDKAVEVNGKHEGAGDADPNEDSKPESVPQNAETPKSQHTEEKVKHKMLLHNNDWELIRVEEILNDVHQRFYAAYDQDPPRGKRTADLRNFITGRKREVFAGLHFTFSSVFPTNQDPRAQPIWRQAEKFGARCHATWNDNITHVIAVKLRSEKTERGQRKPGVFVLHPQWLWESVAQWRRVDEEPYVEMLRMLDEASAQAGSSTPAPAPHLDLAGSSASSSPEAGSSTGSAPIIVIEEVGADGGAVSSEDLFELGEADAAALNLGVDEVQDERLQMDADGNQMDWAAVNDELDAFLAETDDDDDMGLGDDDEDGDADMDSDASGHLRRVPNPRKRRRSQSVASSDGGDSGVSTPTSSKPSSPTGSPLQKRLKVSQDRPGSKLKQEVHRDSHSPPSTSTSAPSRSNPIPPSPSPSSSSSSSGEESPAGLSSSRRGSRKPNGAGVGEDDDETSGTDGRNRQSKPEAKDDDDDDEDEDDDDDDDDEDEDEDEEQENRASQEEQVELENDYTKDATDDDSEMDPDEDEDDDDDFLARDIELG